MEVRNSMQDKKEFELILKKWLIFTIILYVAIGFICYICLGLMYQIVLFNLPISNFLNLISQIAYGVSLLITFPLQIYPIFFAISAIYRCIKKEEYINLE